jgi:hypothetical protein
MAATKTSWKPGQSGNPGGRPRGVARRLRILNELTSDEALARVWNALLEAAIGGDVAAARVVLDRILGPTANLAEIDGEASDLLSMLIAKVQADEHPND